MPRIQMKPDTLNDENRKFEQKPLEQPLFLNSVPKCGTHLLRNIIRMFVPVEQQYHAQFIQFANLEEHAHAFERGPNMFSWGHLLYSDAPVMRLKHARKLLLVRDPYSWVLARARFFVSDEFSGNIDHIKDGVLSVEQLMNLMIVGVYQKAPPMQEIFLLNAVAWIGTDVHLLRYEELIEHLRAIDTPEAEDYFDKLWAACGIEKPHDWRERVQVGSDRKQSGTARENLTGAGKMIEFPKELPDAQKKLVDYVAPNLRKILGYA